MNATTKTLPALQSPLWSDLASPDAYPDDVSDVQVVETHVSRIYLAGEHVYKVKKPVDYGFLDFHDPREAPALL